MSGARVFPRDQPGVDLEGEVNTYRNAKHGPIPTYMSRTANLLCVYATLCLDRNSGFPRASPYYSAAPTAPRVSGAQISPSYPARAQALRGLQPDGPSCPSAQGGCGLFPQVTRSNAFHIHICLSNLGNILKICLTWPLPGPGAQHVPHCQWPRRPGVPPAPGQGAVRLPASGPATWEP